MDYQDRQITCIDCSQPFLFSAGEQEFYARKGFREEPKRCKPCREQRKTKREGGNGVAMRAPGRAPGPEALRASPGPGDVDDDIGNRIDAAPRGPREVRDVRAGGRGAGGSREMFDAVCASCGAAARVPFRPVAGRPVYCRDCYAGQSDRR